MARERIMMKTQHGNLSPFIEATNKHMTMATFAPDLVKWTRKDIEKLLKEDKKEDWKWQSSRITRIYDIKGELKDAL